MWHSKNLMESQIVRGGMKHVSIISPVCNEEGNILPFINAIMEVMKSLPYAYTLLFIDDGSTDSTLQKIKCFACRYHNIHYVSLSRNFGHQSALKAGFDMACGDCVISIDGDMQHPADLIPAMLEKYEEGYDVVYTLRKDDKSLPFFKR